MILCFCHNARRQGRLETLSQALVKQHRQNLHEQGALRLLVRDKLSGAWEFLRAPSQGGCCQKSVADSGIVPAAHVAARGRQRWHLPAPLHAPLRRARVRKETSSVPGGAGSKDSFGYGRARLGGSLPPSPEERCQQEQAANAATRDCGRLLTKSIFSLHIKEQ